MRNCVRHRIHTMRCNSIMIPSLPPMELVKLLLNLSWWLVQRWKRKLINERHPIDQSQDQWKSVTLKVQERSILLQLEMVQGTLQLVHSSPMHKANSKDRKGVEHQVQVLRVEIMMRNMGSYSHHRNHTMTCNSIPIPSMLQTGLVKLLLNLSWLVALTVQR